MLSWIGLMIIVTFLGCCAIGVIASLTQILNVTIKALNTPKGPSRKAIPVKA